MAPNVTVSESNAGALRNSLLQGIANPSRTTVPVVQPAINAAPALPASLLTNAIAHAALLADTPEKWAATLAMLKRNGIDPAGYEDFEKGRAAAVAASGAAPSEDFSS
jgi:hypothetical protein